MARNVDLRKVTADELRRYIAGLLANKFQPHRGQRILFDAVMPAPWGRGIKRGFVRCGRKFGKSSSAIYLAHHRALNFPDQRIYIMCPLLKQVKAIYWEEYRIHEFADTVTVIKEDGTPLTDKTGLVSHIDNQDYRIDFYNGSFIKIDGSDNYNAHRGYNPDLVLADEFADFDARWMPVMIPNLASRNASIVFYGTPPEVPKLPDGTLHQYVQLDNEFQRRHKSGTGFWLHAPTWANDVKFATDEGKGWLYDEKQRLWENNEWYIWEREYCAKIVEGSAHSIFPQFSAAKHVCPHQEIVDRLRRSPDKFEYYCIADPGTESTFAVLFIALDPYANTLYFLDEIYVTDRVDASVDAIMPRIEAKIEELYPRPHAWGRYADSAAAWFINEVGSRYTHGFAPTIKRVGDKQEGISLLRDIFRYRTRIVSDRCQSFANEVANYATDKAGKVMKKNDHLIDCARYALSASDFTLHEYKTPEQLDADADDFPSRARSRFREDVSTIELSLRPDYSYIFK